MHVYETRILASIGNFIHQHNFLEFVTGLISAPWSMDEKSVPSVEMTF